MTGHDRFLLGNDNRCPFCGAKEYASEGSCPCSEEWQCMNPECEGADFTVVSDDDEHTLRVCCDSCDEEYKAIPHQPLEDCNEPFAVD